jgi:hypothetical protein
MRPQGFVFHLAHTECTSSATTLVEVLIKPVAPGPSDWQSTLWVYLRDLRRFAKSNPLCVGGATKLACQFERLVAFPAWGHQARKLQGVRSEVPQSSLSGRRCISMVIAPQSSRCLGFSKSF